MITLINFANEQFRSKQKWNSFTGKFFGRVDRVKEYSPEDIDDDFLASNKDVLKFSKGFGNYFWKSYIINKALKEINLGDYLLYADSGSVFLKRVEPLVKHLEKSKKSVMCFRLPLIEKQWTKRDALILMDCDYPEIINSGQIMGGFILIKKCVESEEFIKGFLNFSLDKRILSDNQNVLDLPNYHDFIEHRHDQSILSLLCKKNEEVVLLEGDISDYGFFPHKYLHKQGYLFDKNMLVPDNHIFKGTVLCNRKVHPIKYSFKYFLKIILYKFSPKRK